METGRHPEWKDVSDRVPIYKSYWAQWKSLVFRNGVLVQQWESADGKKMAQVVIPHSKVKEVLTEMQGSTSGGHVGVNKTIDKVRQRYYCLHLRGDVESSCQQCDTCAASRGPRTRSRGLMHQYNVGPLSRELQSTSLVLSRRATGETDIYWSPWITSQSVPKYTPSQTKRHRQ
jgi:hypothetical protein